MLYQLDMARNCFFDHLLPECPLPLASCFPLPVRSAIRIVVPQIDSRRIDFARLRSIIADRPPRRSDSLPSLHANGDRGLVGCSVAHEVAAERSKQAIA